MATDKPRHNREARSRRYEPGSQRNARGKKPRRNKRRMLLSMMRMSNAWNLHKNRNPHQL